MERICFSKKNIDFINKTVCDKFQLSHPKSINTTRLLIGKNMKAACDKYKNTRPNNETEATINNECYYINKHK